jgi:hypothetical protein
VLVEPNAAGIIEKRKYLQLKQDYPSTDFATVYVATEMDPTERNSKLTILALLALVAGLALSFGLPSLIYGIIQLRRHRRNRAAHHRMTHRPKR